MDTKSKSGLSELDKEILLMEHQRQLNQQENSLLSARLEIKKAERAVERYQKTITSLEKAIEESKAQIADLAK